MDAGKDWRNKARSTEGVEMVGWHHQLNEHELEQTPRDTGRQGSLACCSPYGHKGWDMTERLNNNRAYTIGGLLKGKLMQIISTKSGTNINSYLEWEKKSKQPTENKSWSTTNITKSPPQSIIFLIFYIFNVPSTSFNTLFSLAFGYIPFDGLFVWQ